MSDFEHASSPELEPEWEDFQWNYQASGRDREVLVSFLEKNPKYAEALTGVIIEHLKKPTTRYLSGKQDWDRQMAHEDIYNFFLRGNAHAFVTEPKEGWTDLSYDEKIAEIARQYPEISISQLGKIISDQKKSASKS